MKKVFESNLRKRMYEFGWNDAIEEFEKMLNNEIKDIIKLNKNKNVNVNHNFWKAHIDQLKELEQQLQKLKEKKQ